MRFDSPFAFVIDTDQYAGNFEREICAYCTGMVGNCGVGQEYADDFTKEVGDPEKHFRNIVVECDLGSDCLRPVTIYPTNKSVAILFGTRPSKKQLKLLKERAIKFMDIPKHAEFDVRPKIKGFRLFEQKREVTEEKL